MNNKIVCVTKDEARAIKENSICNKDIFFAEINGAEIRTEEEYVRAMANAFIFPIEIPMVRGWLNDYMGRLIWIEQKDIVVLVHDFDLMLTDDLETKREIIEDFAESILPWWEEEVVGHMVGGKPRGFMLYLEKES